MSHFGADAFFEPVCDLLFPFPATERSRQRRLFPSIPGKKATWSQLPGQPEMFMEQSQVPSPRGLGMSITVAEPGPRMLTATRHSQRRGDLTNEVT